MCGIVLEKTVIIILQSYLHIKIAKSSDFQLIHVHKTSVLSGLTIRFMDLSRNITLTGLYPDYFSLAFISTAF